MINTFKNLTGKKIAGLLLIIIIIIAFGFGGFGGGFNLGNQNNIAKINNTKISTKDFMDYLSRSGLSQQVIKENIDKNILEELLSTLVSTKLLDLEIKDLNLEMSEKIIIEKLQSSIAHKCMVGSIFIYLCIQYRPSYQHVKITSCAPIKCSIFS